MDRFKSALRRRPVFRSLASSFSTHRVTEARLAMLPPSRASEEPSAAPLAIDADEATEAASAFAAVATR